MSDVHESTRSDSFNALRRCCRPKRIKSNICQHSFSDMNCKALVISASSAGLPASWPRIGVESGFSSGTVYAQSLRLRALGGLPASMLACRLLVMAASGAPEQMRLSYTGSTSWSPDTGTITFQTSGRMPETKEGFFWEVPTEVKNVIIKRSTTVNGGFRVGFRSQDNPLHIIGEDRRTSIIYGTDAPRWTFTHKVADNDKWKYGSVSVLADAVVYVTNLTAQNPRGYNISGYADHSVIHVAACNLIDTRKGDNNNSDGFIGAAGSSIHDSLISTSDDGIKIYHDITIVNVTIEQHRNGAPIQFGWGGESGHAIAAITNLTIKGVDPNSAYNMAPFTWEAGSRGTRTVLVNGLSVSLRGKTYNEGQARWEPAMLFELKPKDCTLNMTVLGADIGDLPYGLRNTNGRISINGTALP